VALQIANPVVVDKVERLARELGLTKTAAVERAVDSMAVARPQAGGLADRTRAILRQLDAIPDLPGAVGDLDWDADGLPT